MSSGPLARARVTGPARASALLLLALTAGCSALATPASSRPAATHTPPATPEPSPTARPADQWTTYMGDSLRTGAGPSAPAATSAQPKWTATVDGIVYAQPLVSGSTVIAVSERNTVYALDAGGGAVRWHTNLGTAVPLSELTCGDIDPNGVTSTPVVDAASGTLYVVAMIDAPIHHELFALRVADGSVLWHRAADPPMVAERYLQQRGSLNLAHGRVYFSYGGFAGDCGRYHGWVVAAGTDGTGALATWQVPSVQLGAIWAPPGPVVSAAGDIWVTTGNTDAGTGDVAGSYDGGDAVVRLDPGLTAALDQWAPANWAELNRGDVDLGSLAPVLLGHGLVFVAGKEGVGYLLAETHLGGVGGEVYKAPLCDNIQPVGTAKGALFGGAAVAGDTLYLPCTQGLTALRVDPAGQSFRVSWRGTERANTPVLAYGMVWTVVTTNTGDDWSGTLVALDPRSGEERARVALGGVPHFPSPAAAGGSLYVAGRDSVYAVSVS